jgi:hypothetical protein
VISLLDLSVEKPREAMMLRAPETEALYEGSAQKGFGVLSIDGSPMPLGSTATNEPIEIPRSLWGMRKPSMPQGCYSIPVDQEAKQSKANEYQ